MSSNISIRQIAQAVGLHPSTVSLALRNHPKIPLSTRARIKAAARAMGYRADPLVATALSRVRSKAGPRSAEIIAFVTPLSRTAFARHELNREMFRGASERAESLGWKLELFPMGEHGGEAGISRILSHRGIRSTLIGPLEKRASLALDWPQFAAAALGPSLADPALHQASNFQFRSAQKALERLFALGYRRFAFALDRHLNERVERAYAAAVVDFERNNAKDGVECVMAEHNGEPTALERLCRKGKPQILLGSLWEEKWWKAARTARGHRGLAFASLDLRCTNGSIGGIFQNFPHIGALGIDLIVAQHLRNERGVPQYRKHLFIDGEWKDGASCPPLLASSGRQRRISYN